MIMGYTEWSESIKTDLDSGHLDTATAMYVEPFVTGYITSPMARTERDETVQVSSVAFQSIDEIYEHFKKEVASGSRIYLYKILFMPSLPFITKTDPYTFNVEVMDRPVMSEEIWKVRYATI